MALERSSGLLLHISSLPSYGGIGDFGPAAYAFADFLAAAKQRLWQVLPLNPTGYGNSPYAALSAFAGNPLLISMEKLVEAGWLSGEQIAGLADHHGNVRPSAPVRLHICCLPNKGSTIASEDRRGAPSGRLDALTPSPS